MQYLSFSVWLIPLHTVPSESTHVVTDGKCHIFLIHSSLNKCLEPINILNNYASSASVAREPDLRQRLITCFSLTCDIISQSFSSLFCLFLLFADTKFQDVIHSHLSFFSVISSKLKRILTYTHQRLINIHLYFLPVFLWLVFYS